MAHTPAPWRLQPVHLRGSTAYNIEPNIARIPSGLQPQAETDANARLIAAAPNLLAIANDLYPLFLNGSLYADHDRGTKLLGQLRRAIEQAEGREP